MEENESRPVESQAGQAQVAPGDSEAGQSVQNTDTKPVTQPGQAQSTQAQAEESFYADFHSLPPETQEALRPFYKQMQGAFTKKAQDLAKQRQAHSQKIQAYDQFMANPVENIMRMGAQYGLNLTPAQAQQVAQQQQQGNIPPEWSPNAWEEVFAKTGEYISPKMQEMIANSMAPYQEKIALLEREVAEVRASRVKKQLDSIDPNWQMYEDEMRQVLEQLPQLANDIPKLYRLAVPQEVLESKATQSALKRYEQKAQAAKVESSGSTKQSGPAKPGKMSFDEAFQQAKRQLGRK
jgi:hypothetical protein